jgi:V/A-type H+-transporting ATPase subunit B
MAFGEAFERRFVRQDVHENRTVEQTLELGWELLTAIPRIELKRIKDDFLKKYMEKYLRSGDGEKGKKRGVAAEQGSVGN